MNISGSREVTCSQDIRYALPQRITSPGKHIFSLRAARPLENCRISILQNQKILTSKRFIKLMPSEMVRISAEVTIDHPVEVYCE